MVLETGSLGSVLVATCYGDVRSDGVAHEQVRGWVDRCQFGGLPFLLGGDFNWDVHLAAARLALGDRRLKVLDFDGTCFGSGEPSAIDWVLGGAKLVGAVSSWCRVRTSLAAHRALLVRLPGRSDIKLDTLVAGSRPSHSDVFGPMDTLSDYEVLLSLIHI